MNQEIRMETLVTLKRQRGVCKRQLTQFSKFLGEQEQNLDIDRLQVRIDKINDILKTFNTLQTEIETLDVNERELTVRFETEEEFYDAIALANRLKRKASFNIPTEDNNESRRRSSTPASMSHQFSHVKLPKIDLPKFDGKYENWLTFRDSFTSIIYSNTALPPIQKLHYLRSCLKNEASEVIQSLQISDDNYDVAWTLLKERYNNERLIILKHVNELLSLPAIKKSERASVGQLLNALQNHVRALKTLSQPTESWDSLLIGIILLRFDKDTREKWEETLSGTSMPSMKDIIDFLDKRRQQLEATVSSSLDVPHTSVSQQSTSQHKPQSTQRRVKSFHTMQIREQSCIGCKGKHLTFTCPEFQTKSVDQRKEFIRQNKLCYNCMGSHQFKECSSSKRCRVCNGRHHTLIHQDTMPHQSTNADVSPNTAPGTSSGTSIVSHSAQSATLECSPFLYTTAQVIVANFKTGESVVARALIDTGSRTSFISESLTQLLKLPRQHATIPINGLGTGRSGVTRGRVSFALRSRISVDFSFQTEAFVLPRLTARLPESQIRVEKWPHIDGITLADPTFDQPGQISLVLGLDVFNRIRLPGWREGAPGMPFAHETKLGWMLAGSIMIPDEISTHHASIQSFQCSVDQELLDLVQRFWQQEETYLPATLTPEEEQCEQHFIKTVSRDSTGRYTVRLPVKEPSLAIGNSRTPARRMLGNMERRFIKDPSLKSAYSDFLKEYRQLGHMRHVPDSLPVSSSTCYLPHHGVIKESSSTTKLRVVFNGSQKTELGRSLNDNLHTGPKVQTDLADVLMRWRQHRVVFTCDIVKMYRQINVHEDDRDLQRILWRENPEQPVQEYQLCAVTYGLACAPYLAIRVLRQLVDDEGEPFPLASRAIRENTYDDDILSGADNIDQGRELIQQLAQLLKAGGFELQKWTSSHPRMLDDIADDKREAAASLALDQSQIFRALGLAWKPTIDAFTFMPQPQPPLEHPTKRLVLKQIAQLFDPLGWLAPVIVTAKIFMQQLWRLGLGWDDELPESLSTQWNGFLNQLPSISSISIPRWIGLHPASSSVELHGFSDASQAALGAVLYLRVSSDSQIQVTLLAAKTKVAPVKRVTIPRLELCAALLLVRQARHLCQVLQLDHAAIHLWTDSTAALGWIKKNPSGQKDFVRNRVTEIQDFSRAQWHHVAGVENPAGIASRGASPTQLQDSPLWLTGPTWLARPNTSWPTTIPAPDPAVLRQEERVEINAHHLVVQHSAVWDLLERYSKLTRLLRVTAVCKRAARRFQALVEKTTTTDNWTISTLELDDAQNFWVRTTQHAFFYDVIQQIASGTSLPRSHPLARLAPIVDPSGVLRIGGRLAHSQKTFEEKHPIILPQKCKLTTLIIDHHHRSTLHGGTQLTLAAIRQRFWILGGRVPVRTTIHRCVVCARQRAAVSIQQMGQLPPSRVIQSRPFLHTGVDYAGPFTIKAFRGRTQRTYKGYILIFVCFTVSAVHLELVSDYSSAGFIAAYKRFVARRGICTTLNSDCGRNFVGANAELRRLLSASTKESTELADTLASLGTQWRFNPPSAPHFGGKWEAGVKSVKYHLKRVIGAALLTYEEFSTLLTQIEAVLNSRPLWVLSDDPSDDSVITPGHFLTGAALNTIPEPSLTHLPVHRLSHWQRTRRMLEHFWSRWEKEYLQSLLNRTKWHQRSENIKIGSIVLIKDDNLPPSIWPLGRIVETHPGTDGLVRVVTVQTKTSRFKRPITKVCLLPVLADE